MYRFLCNVRRCYQFNSIASTCSSLDYGLMRRPSYRAYNSVNVNDFCNDYVWTWWSGAWLLILTSISADETLFRGKFVAILSYAYK